MTTSTNHRLFKSMLTWPVRPEVGGHVMMLDDPRVVEELPPSIVNHALGNSHNTGATTGRGSFRGCMHGQNTASVRPDQEGRYKPRWT